MALPVSAAWSAGLAPAVQNQVRAATFEVVLHKPQNDPLTYEKPLPLELLPYAERSDEYQSIGTAFALGDNRYVTASHVLAAAISSLYGAPQLRDSGGKVHAIDKVLAYSTAEDFAIVSLSDVVDSPALGTGPTPELNAAVYAVGNALGEGVVIREGTFTSQTPEELDGTWRWIRFSAAASPGNSGGPLLDGSGRVVGVILRKSENENLNYALGIAQVLQADTANAHIRGRGAVGIPVTPRTDTVQTDEKIPLPQPWPQFEQALAGRTAEVAQRSLTTYLSNHRAELFPLGEHSKLALQDAASRDFPTLVSEQQNSEWGAVAINPGSQPLEGNGYLQFGQMNGVGLFRLRLPDGVKLSAAQNDSKIVMDLMLKALNLRRPVGNDSVRITSFGAAGDEITFRDRFGRPWRLQQWPLPYQDGHMLVVSMPVPGGYVGMAQQMSSGNLSGSEALLRMLTDFISVGYSGSLDQWRDYLSQRTLLPDSLLGMSIQIDTGKLLRVRSERFSLDIVPQAMAVNAESILTLPMGWQVGSDQQVRQSAVAVQYAEKPGRYSGVTLMRTTQPLASATAGDQNFWHQLQTLEPPFDGHAVVNGDSILLVAPQPMLTLVSGEHVIYNLALRLVGTADAGSAERELRVLKQGFKVNER
ncbi:MAG: serine protease [Steroidobacteraceae bacterium]